MRYLTLNQNIINVDAIKWSVTHGEKGGWTVQSSGQEDIGHEKHAVPVKEWALWLGVGVCFVFSNPLGFLLLFMKLFGLKNCMQGVKGFMSGNGYKFEGKTADFQKKKSEYTYQEGGKKIVSNMVHSVKREVELTQQKKYVEKTLKNYGKEHKEGGFVLGGFSAILCFGFLDKGSILPALGSLVFLLLAVSFVLSGKKKEVQAQRMAQYLNIIGKQAQFSTEKLSSVVSESLSVVHGDIEKMISLGLYKEAFLDQKNNTLVLENREEYLKHFISDDVGVNSHKSENPMQEGSEELRVLSEIRQVNRDITNKTLSAQIDHIGMITAKIFEYQREHEDKERELHSFLSYYLPTTLKLLGSYSQLEAQQIEGDNITKAKKQIEDMMDKIVEGFEKQLDQLFQRNTMDIATDIKVLEQMMEKDGLYKNGVQFDGTTNLKL